MMKSFKNKLVSKRVWLGRDGVFLFRGFCVYF